MGSIKYSMQHAVHTPILSSMLALAVTLPHVLANSVCHNGDGGHQYITPYLPTIPDSPELLRKSASNYGITARGKIITDILD